MKSKALLYGLFLLILSMGLVACSGSSESSGEDTSSDTTEETDAGSEEEQPAEEQEEVEIRFSWWGDTGRNDIYNQIVDHFEEQHPHITVKREFGGWNDYWDRLATQTAGGNAPDVVSMHQFYVSDYARRGALLNLQEFIGDSTINLENFPEATVNAGKVGEDTFMVAKGITMPGWAYNTAVFDELGVEYPDVNWTWDDFANTLAELDAALDSDQQWASANFGGGYLQPNFRYFVRQRGKDLFTEDGKLGFEKEDLVAWWSMWDDFRQKGYTPDAATETEFEGAPLEQNLFVTGKTALTQIPANQMHLYQEQFDEGEIQMVRMPTSPDGETGEYLEGAFLSISEKSDHPKEAAMFIDFFVNAEEAWELFKVEQGPPGSTEGSEFVKQFLEPAQERAVTFIQEAVQHGRPAPYAPEGVGEVEQAFADNASAISFGQISVEEAVDNFMEIATSVLQ